MTSPKAAQLRLAPFKRVVTDSPVSYSVYSAFSYYGLRRGGELSGTWLVSALGVLGHSMPAVRQTLYRMEKSRELASRLEGRVKFYSLTAAARAEAEAGLAKIMGTQAAEWDGQWTIVQFAAGTEERIERERLRELMRVEGFAALAPGVFIHPRDRSQRLLRAADGHAARDVLSVFRGARVGGEDQRAFVARHWDLDDLATRYSKFVARYATVLEARRGLTKESCFVLRFAVVFDYLETAWDDPQLPADLLPPDWPGSRAQAIAAQLYDSLLADALSYGDELNAVSTSKDPRA